MSKMMPGNSATDRHGLRGWLIGLLIDCHGLRVSEACDLRWDHLDFVKHTIVVRRHLPTGTWQLSRDRDRDTQQDSPVLPR
jgi:integrase